MKKHIMITVDFDVWVLAKRKIDNLSNEINEYLKKRVNVEKTETEKTIQEMESEYTSKLAEANILKETAEKLKKKEKEEEDEVVYSYTSPDHVD